MKIYVYNLEGNENTNTAKFKLEGYIEDNTQILDHELEIKHNPDIENISIKAYKCRLLHNIVERYRKIPIMYLSIHYERKYAIAHLMNIYIMFDIQDDTKEIKSLDELLSTNLNGKYSVEIVTVNKSKSVSLDKYLGDDKMIEYLLLVMETDEIQEIIKEEINNLNNDRRKRFGEFMDHIPESMIEDLNIDKQ